MKQTCKFYICIHLTIEKTTYKVNTVAFIWSKHFCGAVVIVLITGMVDLGFDQEIG